MIFFKAVTKVVVGVLVATFCVTPASAATLFDNGLPNTNTGLSIVDNNESRDDFTLEASADINHVTFYFQNYNGITDWNQDITYNIWDAQYGGNLLATGAGLNVTPVDSGLPWCCGGGNAWVVDFDLQADFTARAGETYWLGLTGATGAQSAWWVTTDLKNGMTNPEGYEFAFSLSGEVNPAESVPVDNKFALALLILLLGTAGFITVRRYH